MIWQIMMATLQFVYECRSETVWIYHSMHLTEIYTAIMPTAAA